MYILLIDQEIKPSLKDFFRKQNFEQIVTNNQKTKTRLNQKFFAERFELNDDFHI